MKKTRGFSAVGIVIGIVAVVLVGVVVFAVVDSKHKDAVVDDYDLYSVIDGSQDNGGIGDHVKGQKDAPVLIFEYADYQCPGCASINLRVNQAVEQADGKLAVVYRSFLLPYHQNGTAAASAAEAAGLQGYWKEYADMLFKEQADWEYADSATRKELFEQYFEEVSDGKGDVKTFNEDIASDAVSKKISFDMSIAKALDVGGTPSFYVDGQLINWSEPSEITINGKTISWDTAQTGDSFVELLQKIVAAKTEN